MRNSKGITLIALVITIVVLLILAAVSITALTDEDKGVVKKAKQAAQKTEEAADKEEEDIQEILDYADSETEVVYYTVTFSYKNSSGTTVTTEVQVESGKNIIDIPTVPNSYTSGSITYTFANKWVTTEGGSTVASLENITSNKIVYAVYNTSETCFVKGTEILTENGLINIEDIQVGMKVYSYNELTGKVELKEVKTTFINYVDYNMTKVIINGEIIESTAGHDYYEITKGWVDACTLEIGDKVLNSNNEVVEIRNVETIKFEGNELIKVYNLEVEDNHNYYVGENNVLVHNVVTHSGGGIIC